MIDKIFFKNHSMYNGIPLVGLLIYSPYPDINADVKMVRISALRETGFEDETIIDIPESESGDFERIFRRIKNGDYDKPVDNLETENDKSDIFMSQ